MSSHPSMVRDRASCPIVPFFINHYRRSGGVKYCHVLWRGEGARCVTTIVSCAHTSLIIPHPSMVYDKTASVNSSVPYSEHR